MPEFHAEPYIYLPAVTHKSALVAWGAFYFRVTSSGTWKLVDDARSEVRPSAAQGLDRRALGAVRAGARRGLRLRPAPSSPTAKTEATNHCWVAGLAPDTEYTYKVFVKGEEWAEGERWDWSAAEQALVQTGRPLRQPVPHASGPEAARPRR